MIPSRQTDRCPGQGPVQSDWDFSTTTTDNKNRNQNIRLAADAIDGVVLKPGEEFSFNLALATAPAKGYQPAGAYRNGVLIEEPGGGVLGFHHAVPCHYQLRIQDNGAEFPQFCARLY